MKITPKLLPILHHPHEILRTKATEIKKITAEIKQLAADMLCTMYAAGGIGLAANQVGQLHRIFVTDLNNSSSRYEGQLEQTEEAENCEPNPMVFINPEILEESEELFEFEEGCLSIPGARGLVKRPKKITLKYLDLEGQEQSITAEDLFSTCIQHEIDHLDGVLFLDHLSPLKRNVVLRKAERALRETESNRANV